jgi:glycosyltransferase involved in cell wall biosynthesis
MLNNKTIVVVLPAYNAERTLKKTYDEIPKEIIDRILLVDDKSIDNTVSIANELGISEIISHDFNKGYGANQKTCYKAALKYKPDIIVLLHPDYQYPPRLIPALCTAIAYGHYKVAIGSRILGKGALRGGMPVYKYISNRILTFIQNILLNRKLSEYHTGFRAFSSDVLNEIHFEENNDGFLFDNQLLCQVIMNGHDICEISCPTRYEPDSSNIGFWDSVQYGLGVLIMSVKFLLHKTSIRKSRLFRKVTSKVSHKG